MEFSAMEGFAYAAVAIWAVVALLATCTAVLVGKRQIGRSLHVVRGSRRMRNCVLLVCLFLSAILLLMDEAPNPLALIALGAGLLVAIIAPGVEDGALGEDGARCGWQARNWAQLKGWRLVGSHLRFLVHGELVAVEVPPELMGDLRTKLEALCPSEENKLGSASDGDAPVG